MEKQIILSKRLEIIMNSLPKGAYFADIGSDHAYLPIAVCLKDSSARAIAGEVNEGPYQSAVSHVARYQLNQQIKVIKGDGLDVIQSEAVDHIVIAGMGGGLIRSILERGKHHLAKVRRLILQPNVDSHYVRVWLHGTDYRLTSESILKEDGHIYEILIADQVASNQKNNYSDKEIFFGPYLLKEQTKPIRKKWKKERKNTEGVIKQMKRAKNLDLNKINQFKQKLIWIEEVLKDG